MKLDKKRLRTYLQEIQSRKKEIEKLLKKKDEEILSSIWTMRGLKYALVEIAEAMANTLQHILAKMYGIPVTGYVETILKSGETEIISQELARKLRPFFDFRNSIIHRYWIISDSKLLTLVRENLNDFSRFIDEIEKFLENTQQ